MKSTLFFLIAALVASSFGDVYLHSPRGANDRCDEKSNNRNNANRCFDSENNAAGGYGVCDKEMIFYEDTIMAIEFYSQHNCGNGANLKEDPNNPEPVHCMHVLQLGCDWAFKMYAGAEAETYRLTDGISLGRPGADAANTITKDEDKFETFGGTCTDTKPTSATCQDANRNQAQCATLNLADGGQRGTFNSDACECSPRKMQTYCYHEPEAFYQKCGARERNKGLFNADQNVNNNNGALRTRQEPNSQRYGFECVEERDYWPYWHPSPWIDLAVLTSDTSACPFLQSESQNVKDKCECVNSNPAATTEEKMEAWKFNQPLSCTSASFSWVCGSSFNWKKPDCVLAPSQPDNSLARVDTKGDNSQKTDGSRLAHYDWKVDGTLIPQGQTETRCLIRLRYNISTYETPADFDQNDDEKIKNNPVRTFGAGDSTLESTETIPLRMAVNTAQFGRVFEDRTYTFVIRQRPSELRGKTIHNLNVRGKRGNIAQVRNCFEYDFVPLVLNANVGDIVHFQWCLTDYNDNGNAGEGRAGTDRVNVVPITGFDHNILQALNSTNSIFSEEDLKALAWIGQKPENCYTTAQMLGNGNNGNDPKSCHFLNGPRDENGMPTAYFSYMAKVIKSGTLHYISSRNNNFTNRSQKATITTSGASAVSSGAIAGIVVGSVVGVAAIAGVAFLVVKKGGLSFAGKV